MRYGSYQELLDDPEVEAVYISLPNSHAPGVDRAGVASRQARAVREAAGAAPGGVAAAFDVAQREGRLLMEAFMYRHNPQTQASWNW